MEGHQLHAVFAWAEAASDSVPAQQVHRNAGLFQRTGDSLPLFMDAEKYSHVFPCRAGTVECFHTVDYVIDLFLTIGECCEFGWRTVPSSTLWYDKRIA